MTFRISSFLAAAIAAASVAGAKPLLAENWRNWRPSPDNVRVEAELSPWLDSRMRGFNRNDYRRYTSFFALAAHPGEVVLKPGSRPLAGDGPFTLRVEVVPVPRKRAGIPVISESDHYAENPFLPFNPPTGRCDAPVFASETVFPKGAAFPLRAAFQMPDFRSMYSAWPADETVLRVRWRLADDAGIVGSGVLDEAFGMGHQLYWGSGDARKILAISPQPDAVGKDRPDESLFATPSLPEAWPAIAEGADEIVFDAPFIDANFPGAEAFGKFAGRAALLDVAIRRLDESGDDPEISVAVPHLHPLVVPCLQNDGRHAANGKKALGQTTEDVVLYPRWHLVSCDSDEVCERFKEHQAKDEEFLEKARIPGMTLGRDQRWYVAATVLFMVAFAVGTCVILVRFFAFRKGEARLAVWRVLPAWCVAAAAFALLAVRPLLDRSPRADVTEWRYSVCGMAEELRIGKGRAQSFLESPADWTFPSDGWFVGDSMKRGGAVRADIAAGTQTLSGAHHTIGDLESVSAVRFAPHDGSPVSVSPNGDPKPADPADFKKALSRWLSSSFDEPAPSRTVTANRDFDAVWVWTMRQWYALGPMKKGEAVALDASRRIWQGMDLSGKTYANLFKEAPLGMRVSGVVNRAEKWMSKADGPEGPPPIDEELLRRLDEVVVFALRAPGEEGVGLAPVFAGGRRPVVTSRIVEVEVFQ